MCVCARARARTHVCLVVTTVGFGDIVAHSTEERIAYIVLMICGAFVWGTLLAQVGEIHRAASFRDQEKLIRVSTAVDFLNENDVPRGLRQQIIDWERFYMEHGTSHIAKKEIISRLPKKLQHDLVSHLHSDIIQKVPFFQFLANITEDQLEMSHDKPNRNKADDTNNTFMSELWMKLEYKSYEAGAVISKFGEPADRLIIVASGKATVEFDHDEDGFHREAMEVCVGDYLGDFAILGDTSWGTSSLLNATKCDVRIRAMPMEYVICLELSKTDFDDCTEKSTILIQSAVERYRNMYLAETQEREHKKGGKINVVTYMHVALKWGSIVQKLFKLFNKGADSATLNLAKFSQVVQSDCFKNSKSMQISSEMKTSLARSRPVAPVSGTQCQHDRPTKTCVLEPIAGTGVFSASLDSRATNNEAERFESTRADVGPDLGLSSMRFSSSRNDAFSSSDDPKNTPTLSVDKASLIEKLDRISTTLIEIKDKNCSTDYRFVRLERQLEGMALKQDILVQLIQKIEFA